MFNRHQFFHPRYAPVYIPILLSLLGALVFSYGDREFLSHLFEHRLSPAYIIISPFLHLGAAHFLLNAMALHYIGGQLLLPAIGAKRFTIILITAALTSQLINTLISPYPAIGISGAVMALLSCSLYPFGRLPMKLLFIHDILRLKPFLFRNIALFIVAIDICGIIFGWHFFAHWAHLGGFATGLAFGYIIFRRFR